MADSSPLHPIPHIQAIAQAVPAWLAGASRAQQTAYAAAALASAASQVTVRAITQRLEPADRFVERHVRQALQQTHGLNLDVRRYELVSLHYPIVNPNLQIRREVVVTRRTLLEAAMANFTADECQPGGFEPGSVILPLDAFKQTPHGDQLFTYDPLLKPDLEPHAFAQLCRRLDPGKRYQAHLQQLFHSDGSMPSDDNPGHVYRQLRANLRNDLQLQARRAQLEGQLSDSGLATVLALCAEGAPPIVWNLQTVRVHSLRLLATWSQSGTALRRALLFTQGGNMNSPCLAYLPGTAQAQLVEYPTVQAFADALRERLRDEGYCAAFKGFVALAQQPQFSQRLGQTLCPASIWHPSVAGEPDLNADLGLRLDPVPGDSIEWLRKETLDQLRDDAKTLVASNADLDARQREQRWQTFLALGLDALQVAALFVPVVGTLMMGVGALQLLDEVFVGVDDWTHGQTQEALGHLLSVAENLAQIGITAGVGVAMRRSAFVEAMLPVLEGDGRTRLVNRPLADFACDFELPDEAVANTQGQFEYQGERYIRLDGRLYRQTLDVRTGQWCVAPPQASLDQRIALRHNEQGAWRAAHEDPSTWPVEQAMRRLGPDLHRFDDATLGHLQQASGFSLPELQRLHAENLPRPALLQETITDFTAWAEVESLPPETRAQAFALRRAKASSGRDVPVAAGPLLRDFPALAPSAVVELVAQASPAERGRLIGQGRVPLRLAEQARLWLRERRLNRALAGLLWQGAKTGDSLLLSEAFKVAGDDDLAVFQRASADRSAAAKAIGQCRTPTWWRPPVRLPDGRAGYPLSGRRGPLTSRLRRLRQLYPLLDEQQLQALHDGLGATPDLQIGLRAAEYHRLRTTLASWSEATATALDEHGEAFTVDPVDRQLAMNRLLAAWRREAPLMRSSRGRGQGYVLDLSDLRIGTLPEVTGNFNHVFSLTLDGALLEHLPEGFLRSFARLEELEMQGNRFTEIPTEVGLLTDLNVLTLEGNRLQGSATLFDGLRNLSDLQVLILRDNPMQLPERAMRTLGELSSLRTLSLDGSIPGQAAALIPHLEALPNLDSLWLRNNGLVMTPALIESLARIPDLAHLELSGNPLGDTLDLRPLTEVAVLGLRDCGLTRWPAGLTALMNQRPPVLRSVALDGNPLTQVPVLQGLPFFAGDEFIPQPLRISAAGLDGASRARLSAAGVLPVDLPVLAESWRVDCPADLLILASDLQDEPGAEYFFEALDRAQETQEYRLDPGRGRQRIQDLLRSLVQPAAGDDGQGLQHLREQVFQIGDEAVNTCGDGIQLLLNRCENLVLLHRTALGMTDTASGWGGLLALARQFFRVELLDDTAVRITQARMNRREFHLNQVAFPDQQPPPNPPALYPADDYVGLEAPDEAEIRLRLRLDLADRLNLAPQPASMRYYQALSEGVRNQVVTDVLGQDTEGAFVDWLVEQPFWRRCLERRYAERFAQLDREWDEGHLYLFEIASSEPEPGPISNAVAAALDGVLGARGWLGEGQGQVVVLTADEQSIARQALQAGQAEARRTLIQTLTVAAV